MWIPFDNWQAASSFDQPVAPPGVEPDAAPLICVSFNATWMPYVLASLMQLTQPAAWNASPSAVLTVLDQATQLIEQFITGVGCVSALEFRFDSSCGLQVSTDGGVTYVDVPGWNTFAPTCFQGPQGIQGVQGIQGIQGIQGPPGETVGPPANPLDNTTAQNACNIAAYLATQVIQASLQHVLTEIQASQTLVQTVQSLLGLVFVIDVPVAITLEAATLLFNVIQASTSADIQAGLNDSGMWHNILCAIYNAIITDGAVTTANFEAVDTAIDGVTFTNAATQSAITGYVENLGATGMMWLQQQGPIYAAVCSSCTTGCAPAHASVIGTNVASWSESGVSASSMTQGGSTEYSGVLFDAVASPGQLISVNAVVPSGGHEFADIWFSQLPLTNGGPNGGNNAWVTSVDARLESASGTWYLISHNSIVASGSGANPGVALKLLYDGATQFHAYVGGSLVASITTSGFRAYSPGCLGFWSGESYSQIQVCIGS